MPFLLLSLLALNFTLDKNLHPMKQDKNLWWGDILIFCRVNWYWIKAFVTGYALMVSSSKSIFMQLKGSLASQFSLSTISLYTYKIKAMQNTVRIPHKVTSLLLVSTDSNSFHMNNTQFKPNNPREVTPSLLLRLLVKFFGKEYSGWAMAFTLLCPVSVRKHSPHTNESFFRGMVLF